MLTADLVREIAAGAALKPQDHKLFKLEDIAMGSWVQHIGRERGFKVRIQGMTYLLAHRLLLALDCLHLMRCRLQLARPASTALGKAHPCELPSRLASSRATRPPRLDRQGGYRIEPWHMVALLVLYTNDKRFNYGGCSSLDLVSHYFSSGLMYCTWAVRCVRSACQVSCLSISAAAGSPHPQSKPHRL